MSRLRSGLAVALALSSGAVVAQEIGDKDKGLAYARKNCTECHEVEKEKRVSPFSDVPSFQDAADSEGMSHRALAVWLKSSHPNMPNFIIPADDIDDIIAYIMSLRTPK